jgi:Transposase IS200 like.
VLSELVHDFNWAVHAYCLMDNHFHLLIETPEGKLSKGMRHLSGVYTQRFIVGMSDLRRDTGIRRC